MSRCERSKDVQNRRYNQLYPGGTAVLQGGRVYPDQDGARRGGVYPSGASVSGPGAQDKPRKNIQRINFYKNREANQ